MHPTSAVDVIEGMPGGNKAYTEDEKSRVLEWVEGLKGMSHLAAPTFYIPKFSSSKSGYVDGWLISSPLTPREMMWLSKTDREMLMESYMTAAKTKGANVVGLGAYTSVISKSGVSVSDHNLPITTGNAYTALVSTDAIRQICHSQGRLLKDLHIGVVGAGGSVGRLALLDIAPECKSVSLIGSSASSKSLSKLRAVAGELISNIFDHEIHSEHDQLSLKQNLQKHGDKIFIPLDGVNTDSTKYHCDIFEQAESLYDELSNSASDFPIRLTDKIETELLRCDIVITATSDVNALIDSSMLKTDAIVCDVARPSDLATQSAGQMKDIFVFEGGLVNMPSHKRFGRPNILGLSEGVSLACLSETIILAMSQVTENYSIGGESSLEEARKVFNWGKDYGFSTFIKKV